MTTVYNDYLTAASNFYSNIAGEGIINIPINNVFFNVKLVVDDYIPNETHKPIDVEKYIISGVGVLIEEDIVTLGMSAIVDKAKAKMTVGIQAFQYEVFQNIDEIITDTLQAEKVKQLLMQPEINWMELAENGVKYFVFESPEHDILCFTEPITL